jgi:pimeloyl-ACP methyl ester carboxylesterase
MAVTEEQVTVADGVELHVVRWSGGTGPPFVLVHGLASNARLWDGVAAELAAAGHPVVAVDLRGHGHSTKPDVGPDGGPDGGYDMATVADDLHALIVELGLDRPVVAGQSWGGNVVVELAARHPDASRAIAGIDGGAIELSERFHHWEACAQALRPPAFAGMAAEDFERLLREAHPDWPDTGIRGTLGNVEVRADGTVAPWLTLDRHLAVLRGLWEHRPIEALRAIRVPVLLVGAEPGADLRRAEAAGPHVRIERMAGDHDLHAQHPVQVAALLRTLAD